MFVQDFMENAEKLCANEEKVKRLTEKWTGKWQEACAILEVSTILYVMEIHDP